MPRPAHRPLRSDERRLLAVLGGPTLAMAFATTIVSTYVPVLARSITSSAGVIGLLITGEGLMALFLPLLVGTLSDRVRDRGGPRLLFVAAAAPLTAGCLAALGLLSSLVALGLLVAAFFAGNFVTYEPYRALYPDLVEDEVAGRAQGTQALWRGGGTILALAGGGALLALWRDLPFALAAAFEVLSLGALLWLLPRVSRTARETLRHWREVNVLVELRGALSDVRTGLRALLRRHPELRFYMAANCLWELSLGALKTFVVLYVTRGLGFSLASSSLIIGAVAVVILLGAYVSGRLADRLGALRVMHGALWLYGLALLVPVLTRETVPLLVAVPIVAFGGGLAMTLPYAILIPLMPRAHHGMMTGFYSLSRGLGVMLGPLLGGFAIQLLGGDFASTQGYAAFWIVSGGAILLSIPALRGLRAHIGPASARRLAAGSGRAS